MDHYYLVAASKENTVCIFETQGGVLNRLQLQFVFRAQFNLRQRMRQPLPVDDTDP